MIKRRLGAAGSNVSTKDRGEGLARGPRLFVLPYHHQANLADHPESIPARLQPPQLPQAALSPIFLRACPSQCLGMGVLPEQGVSAPCGDCPCLSCTMTIPAPSLGLSIFIQLKVSASLSCPVIEATLEGMVGILRLSHSQAGKNTSVGGGPGRGWQTGNCLVSAPLC